jgi:hypothetical protein
LRLLHRRCNKSEIKKGTNRKRSQNGNHHLGLALFFSTDSHCARCWNTTAIALNTHGYCTVLVDYCNSTLYNISHSLDITSTPLRFHPVRFGKWCDDKLRVHKVLALFFCPPRPDQTGTDQIRPDQTRLGSGRERRPRPIFELVLWGSWEQSVLLSGRAREEPPSTLVLYNYRYMKILAAGLRPRAAK